MASQRHPAGPFWDFIQSLDPSQHPGPGVDSSAGPPPDYFGPGFPFHLRFGAPGRHGPPGPWDEWEQWFRGPEEHGRHGRHRSRHENQANPSNEHQPQETTTAPAEATREVGGDEKEHSPDTVDVPDPAEVTPEDSDDDFPSCGRGPTRPGRGRGFGHGHGRGHGHGHGHGHGPGPRGHGRGGRGGFRRGHHHFGAPPPPPPPHHHQDDHHHPGGRPPFDFAGLMRGLAEQFGGHPNAASGRDNRRDTHRENESDAFEPPVDVFNTDRAYILHVALPGAKKEDIGVSWDPDSGMLRIAGVVHRPGDEAFLQSLTSAERRVGVFERTVALPPPGAAAKDEVDGFGIAAKMEDGLLVVTVPKVEKEWTEIRKVDIE